MSKHDVYKKIQRSRDGVAGIRCNCCRIGTVKQHKALSNRLVRRSMNMNPRNIRDAHEEYLRTRRTDA